MNFKMRTQLLTGFAIVFFLMFIASLAIFAVINVYMDINEEINSFNDMENFMHEEEIYHKKIKKRFC